MPKGRILVVEDDFDIANMLRIYFEGEGYEIIVSARGEEALKEAQTQPPDLIMLDILLPDMDGFDVCRELRHHPQTHHIPIIFLTQKDERSDLISGLELGADDYITKPFDIHELKLRTQNAIARAERERMEDPRTELPTGHAIENELNQLLSDDPWTLLDCGIEHFTAYKSSFGFIAGDQLLREVSICMRRLIQSELDGECFLGHAGGGNFIIICHQLLSDATEEGLIRSMTKEVNSILDIQTESNSSAERGQDIKLEFAVGVLRSGDHEYTTISEITQRSSVIRQKDGS